MKIYLVMEDCGEDIGHIYVRAFTSKEKAEIYISKQLEWKKKYLLIDEEEIE